MSKFAYTPLGEIDNIHADLHRTFRSGKTKPIAYRKQQLLQLFYMLADNKDRIYDTLASDLGRSAAETDLLELAACLAEAKLAYDNVEKWAKPEGAGFSLNWFITRPTIRKEPKGVVLIISPFNYPWWLTISPLAGAIAAGNAVLIKPSELVPATSALYEELFKKYMDPQAIRVVNGAVEETTRLLSLPWDHILYTGSGRVGKVVATAAAKHLTPVTLELGGKSPVVVDPNCDLKLAARRILWGKFANAGQTCVAPDYILIPKEGVDPFIHECEAVYSEFYPEGPYNSKSYSRIVTTGHFDRLKRLLDNTGGSVVLGGQTDSSLKYMAPTVVKDVGPDDALMSDEIFGPILPIVSVKNVDEAIQFINARDRPLSLYVFTQDPQFKRQVIENTISGAVLANDTLVHTQIPGLPFGGSGASGSGGYHTGKYSFDMFTYLRSTLDNPAMSEMVLKMRYAPLTEAKRNRIKLLTFPSSPPRHNLVVKSRWGRWFLVFLAIALAVYLTQRKALSRGA